MTAAIWEKFGVVAGDFPASSDASWKPGGRRPWMAGVFGPRQDAESENSRDTANALSVFDVTGKVLSFGYFSLHQHCAAGANGEAGP